MDVAAIDPTARMKAGYIAAREFHAAKDHHKLMQTGVGCWNPLLSTDRTNKMPSSQNRMCLSIHPKLMMTANSAVPQEIHCASLPNNYKQKKSPDRFCLGICILSLWTQYSVHYSSVFSLILCLLLIEIMSPHKQAFKYRVFKTVANKRKMQVTVLVQSKIQTQKPFIRNQAKIRQQCQSFEFARLIMSSLEL